MTQYTTQDILKLIEENNGPQDLDLSGKNLAGIDLTRETLETELEKVRTRDPETMPVWFSEETKGINLQGAKLKGINLQESKLWFANLREANLEGANLQEALLVGADLRGGNMRDANLQEAKLDGASLQEAVLGGADLQEANLGSAKLRKARLAVTILRKASLARADLREVDLWFADLQEANLEGADLRNANLWGANLQRANLRGANLQQASLESTDFQQADLGFVDLKEAKMQSANLQGVNMAYSHLERVDFSSAASLEEASFYGAFFDNTRLRAEQLGKAIGEELESRYNEAREAYLNLKNNFANIGRYDDQSWAYVKECQMERVMSHPSNVRKYFSKDLPKDVTWSSWRWWWVYGWHMRKWLLDGLLELICMYGESFWRVLITLFVVYLTFTVAYGLGGSVLKETSVGSQTHLIPTRNIADSAIFSLGALTTMEPVGLRPANNVVQLAAGFEALFGIALTGLLGFVLGNKIRRL